MSAPTFGQLAATAQQMATQHLKHERHFAAKGMENPFFTAYLATSEAALLCKPQSLDEAMMLAAFAWEQASVFADLGMPPDEALERGELLRTAIEGIIDALHQYGNVPLSARLVALDYASAEASQ
jgi:hypothetical protein